MKKHKLTAHQDNSNDLNSKTIDVNERVINLLAEQNMELMEEMLKMKKGMNESLEKFAEDINKNLVHIHNKINASGPTKDAPKSNPKVAQHVPRETTILEESFAASPSSNTQAPGSVPLDPSITQNGPSRLAKYRRKKSEFLAKPKVLSSMECTCTAYMEKEHTLEAFFGF
jgi:hypothetical protein